MKFSLISATSIIALFAAGIGAHAAVLSIAPNPLDIYDLVHDGMTSSDGGDGTVVRQDPLISATAALEAATGGWRTAGFTGRADRIAAGGNGYPKIPLGAAAGTKPDDNLASTVSGGGQLDTSRQARAIGQTRIASLIGTIGSGQAAKEKSGSTVFVSAGSPAGFNDGGADGVRGPSVAFVFAPSSSSTATITVAGAGNFSRQDSGGGFSVAASNSLQVSAPAAGDVAQTVLLSDPAPPTLGYNYAPASSSGGKLNSVIASFSGAVTANGGVMRNAELVVPVKIQTSQLQSGRDQSGLPANGGTQTSQLQVSQGQPGQTGSGKMQTSLVQTGGSPSGQPQSNGIATNFNKSIDLSQMLPTPHGNTQIDGTRTVISASVSANPSATAARYMANVVNAVRTSPAGQSIEAFQIGPSSDPKTQPRPATTVSDPLHEKIMASAGALNNSLALP